MDREDLFTTFLVGAVLNTNPEIVYLYDKENDILFRVKKAGNIWQPYFYNENLRTQLYIEREKNVYKLIEKFNQEYNSICELKQIDDCQKHYFINRYIDSIEHEIYRYKLKEQLTISNLRGNERLIGDILNDVFSGIDYGRKLWLFLEETLKISYYPLGISPESNVYL